MTSIPAKLSMYKFDQSDRAFQKMKESLSLKLYRTSWSPFSKGWVIWSKNNGYITIHCHNRNKKYGCIHIQISHSKHYLATIISNFDFRWPRKNLFSKFLVISRWNFILTCGNNPILKSKSLKLMWIRYSSEVRLLEEFSNLFSGGGREHNS